MKDTGIVVVVNGTSKEDVESAIHRFKKKVERSGILDEYKQRQYYVKPSAQKKLKKQKYAK